MIEFKAFPAALRHFILLALVASLYGASAAAQGCPAQVPLFLNFSIAGPACPPNETCRLNRDVTVNVSSETFGSNYQPQACETANWDFGDGTTLSAPANAPVNHQYTVAGTYTLQLELVNGANRRFASRTLTVANGFVSFGTSQITVQEKAGAVRVAVVRATAELPTTVEYSTHDLTAVAGRHYTAKSGLLTFAIGEQIKYIDVPIIDDTQFYYQSQFQVRLSNGTNGFLIGGTPQLTVSITDDDPRPSISFGTTRVDTIEGENFTVPVLRSGDTASSVTARWFSNAGEGLIFPTQGAVVFEPGQTSKTIQLIAVDDLIPETIRNVGLILDFVSIGAQVGTPSTTTLVIADNEPLPSISIGDLTVREGNADHVAAMRIAISPSSKNPITMSFSVFGGTAAFRSDYTVPAGGTIQIPANVTSVDVPITILADLVAEADEFVDFELSTCCGNALYSLARKRGRLTILDDDLGVGPSQQKVAVGQRGTVRITGGAPIADIIVPITVSDPAIIRAPASITIAAGSHATSFEFEALAPGHATIRPVLPDSFGSPANAGSSVLVYKPVDILFDVDPVTIPTGASIPVRISAAVPQNTPIDLQLRVPTGDFIEPLPAAVTIPPGGSALISVTGRKPGLALVSATLPELYGFVVTSLVITVTDPAKGPQISRVLPASGPIAGGTEVILSGSNFRADCVASFGGVSARTTLIASTSLRATTPAHTAGTFDVVLTCGSEMAIFTNGFTYVEATPEITRITPVFGSIAGGTSVKIAGANFTSNCSLFFGDAPARRIALHAPTEMSAVTPRRDSAGTVDVRLSCDGREAKLWSAFAFTTQQDAPASIIDVAPLRAWPGQTIYLHGTRFRFDDRIAIGTVAATVVTSSADTHEVVLPSVPVGRVSIDITDTSGRTTTTGPILTVIEPIPPTVTSTSPSTVGTGGEVTIEGRGFRDGYTVYLGEWPTVVASMRFDRLIVRLPASVVAGEHTLNFRNSSGVIATVGPKIVVVTRSLSLTRTSPPCGSAEGSAQMLLHGSGFGDGLRVRIGELDASSVAVFDPNTALVTVPRGTLGLALISVTQGQEQATLTNGFTYFAPLDAEPPCGALRTRAMRR